MRLRTSKARSLCDPRTGRSPSVRISSVTPARTAVSSNRCPSSLAAAPSETRSSRALPDSSLERSSRSATIRESRTASRSSCDAKRGIAAGSSAAACRRVSATAWIVAAGVFSSWDAFATKSRRTASSCRCCVTSRTTTRVASSAAGVIVPRSQRVGTPVSISTDVGSRRSRLSWIAVRRASGSTASRDAGTDGR